MPACIGNINYFQEGLSISDQVFKISIHLYFLSYSKIVTGICSRPCSHCILAEYNLSCYKYENTWQASFLKSQEQAYQGNNSGETQELLIYEVAVFSVNHLTLLQQSCVTITANISSTVE